MTTAGLKLTLLFCLLLQGCVSVHSLDRHDRIPHESEKGYIKFFSTFDTDKKDGLCFPGYMVDKEEHGYVLRITQLGLPTDSMPISDRLGSQKYIIAYPDNIACKVKDGFTNKTQAEQAAMEEVVIDEIEYAMLTIKNWIGTNTFSSKEFMATIQKNMVTPVGLNSFFAFQQEKRMVMREEDGELRKTNDTVQIYRGTLEVKTGEPSSIPVVPEEGVVFSGPGIYSLPPQQVYARALQAVESLEWKVKQADEQRGHLLVEIPRMLEQNTIMFDVGIFPTADDKTQVDLSSHSAWQRWGSYNMALSREKIQEFYTALDTLINER